MGKSLNNEGSQLKGNEKYESKNFNQHCNQITVLWVSEKVVGTWSGF